MGFNRQTESNRRAAHNLTSSKPLAYKRLLVWDDILYVYFSIQVHSLSIEWMNEIDQEIDHDGSDPMTAM